MKIRFDRLEFLATTLDFADKAHAERGEPTYDQNKISYKCGAPACALGHYTAANAWRGWKMEGGRIDMGQGFVDWDSRAVRNEFGLTLEDHAELFASDGCGDAKTAKQAAKYIRKFIEDKRSRS